MNAYVSLQELKSRGALNTTGTAADARVLNQIVAVSREVDAYCGVHFYTQEGTKFYNGSASTTLLIDDNVGVTSLKEDSTQDGTYDVTWNGTGENNTTDFFLEPYNAEPTSEDHGRPYYKMTVNPNTPGSQDIFETGRRNYEIVGKWGYSSHTRTQAVTVSGTGTTNATATSLAVSAAGIEVGWTIVIGTEQLFVESTGTGANLTVRRGVNGAPSANISNSAAITYYTYPPTVTEAVLMQTSRLFRRAQGGYASEVSITDAGINQPNIPRNGLDSDVKLMLGRFKKPAVIA